MLDQASSQEQHERFVERVRQSGIVWGLRSDEGWAVAPSSQDGIDAMPFWSDQAYAERCAREEWENYAPEEIAIEKFLTAWLPGMARDGHLVGTNWNSDLVGKEIDPIELRGELLGLTPEEKDAVARDQDLVIVPIPALVAVLRSLELGKGAPLTEEEVLEIRDDAACIALPPTVVARLAETRGYADIDPANAWEEWLEVRKIFDEP